jgi:hypothetical protein
MFLGEVNAAAAANDDALFDSLIRMNGKENTGNTAPTTTTTMLR